MTETLSREELHSRISKSTLNPGDCEVVGWMETSPPRLNADALFGLPADMYEIIIARFAELKAEWIARNVELFGREYPGSKCEHCGNRIKYAGIVKYLPTGQHFIVGETCADERMSLANRREHDLRLLKMAIQHRAEMAARDEARARFYREHPAEAEYLFDENREYNQFMDDLARKLDRYGDLSEKQLACVTREVEKIAKREQRIAERAETMKDAPVLTEGRYVIEGTVVGIKSVPGWNPDETVQKIIVEMADGNRVYGSVPSKLYDEVSQAATDFARGLINRNPFAESDEGIRGQRVRFTAKVERSQDDEHFGFYSRPTKAEFVTEEA